MFSMLNERRKMGRAARSEPYTDEKNAMKLKYTHFLVIKNTIKRKEFKIAYESSILFQSFLYASIPAESTSYAPTL